MQICNRTHTKRWQFMKLKWPGLILAFWVSVQGIASPPSFPECGGTLVQFAPIARRYSQYLAVTRIPITQIAAMMERESLEAPGIGPPDRAWKPAHFRWVSRRWVGWRTLLDQSRAGTAASWDRDDPPRQRAEMLRAEQYPVSRVTLRAMEAGTADYAIAIFDLGILDEGWFEFISPRGQVPGETNAFPNFDTPHLQPGAVRVHAGVSLETANAGLEMFVRDCLAFGIFVLPGRRCTQAPLSSVLWEGREELRHWNGWRARPPHFFPILPLRIPFGDISLASLFTPIATGKQSCGDRSKPDVQTPPASEPSNRAGICISSWKSIRGCQHGLRLDQFQSTPLLEMPKVFVQGTQRNSRVDAALCN